MTPRSGAVALIAALASMIVIVASAQAEFCTSYMTCPTNSTKYILRWPGQDQTWKADSLPNDGTLNAVLTHDEYVRIVNTAFSRWAWYMSSIPNDVARLGNRTGDSNWRILWVPQSDLVGGTHGHPWASTAVGSSTSANGQPACFIVSSRTRLAKNPNDGVTQSCWMGDWCGPHSCLNGPCGDHNVDFLGIIMHEFGHTLGLADDLNSAGWQETMYWSLAENDTSWRFPAACEVNEIANVYLNNPAALVRDLTAVQAGDGADIRWSDEMRSQSTTSFEVSWSAAFDGLRAHLATVEVNASGRYQLHVSGHVDGWVHLDENEGGRLVPQGSEQISTVTSGETTEFAVDNFDSLYQALYQRYPLRNAPQSTDGALRSLIFARDSLMEEAELAADFWTTCKGIWTRAISVDSIGGAMQINPTVFQLLPTGGTVGLLGDSWDGTSVLDEPMRLDPMRFTNGFTDLSYPLQPGHNIIGTYFRPEIGGQALSMAQAYPWTTSDANFASRTQNGMVDPGYGVSRMTAANKTEARLAVLKAMMPETNFWGGVSFLSYLHDFGSCKADVASAIVDSLQRLPFPVFMPRRRTDDSPAHPMTLAQRRAAVTTALGANPMYINFFGTGSGGYDPGGFPVDSASVFPVMDSSLPVAIGFTCFSANYAGSEDPVRKMRSFKRLYLAPGAGVRAFIGATAGTWLPGDGHLTMLWYLDWLSSPDKAASIRLADVLRQDLALYPEDSLLVRTMVMIGHPETVVGAPRPPVVGVDPSLENFRVGVFPNPSLHGAMVFWTLPQAARVELAVYDVTGRKVETLIDRTQAPGVHEMRWDQHDLPAGIYFLRLRAGNTMQQTTKVIHLH